MSERTGDALVIFGITGDLAKKMTFRSLYRLESRELLDCGIVGVAVNDWTVDQLRAHAREAISRAGEQIDERVFDRSPAGSRRERRLRRREDLPRGGRSDRRRA